MSGIAERQEQVRQLLADGSTHALAIAWQIHQASTVPLLDSRQCVLCRRAAQSLPAPKITEEDRASVLRQVERLRLEWIGFCAVRKCLDAGLKPGEIHHDEETGEVSVVGHEQAFNDAKEVFAEQFEQMVEDACRQRPTSDRIALAGLLASHLHFRDVVPAQGGKQ